MILVVLFQWSMGRAIIVLTLIIRFALYKNSAQTLQMQQNSWNSNLSKKLEEIQKKYADDPARMQKEMMNVLKTDWMWPLKWCKAMLLQIPVFLGLYWVISTFANFEHPELNKSWFSFHVPFDQEVYSFLHNFVWKYLDVAHHVSTNFYWINLLEPKNLFLAILAGVLMVINMYLTTTLRPAPKTPTTMNWMPDMNKMMQPMMYFMAVMMWLITYSLTAWIGLYMVTTTLFSLWQLLYTNKEVIKIKLKAKFRNKNKPEILNN